MASQQDPYPSFLIVRPDKVQQGEIEAGTPVVVSSPGARGKTKSFGGKVVGSGYPSLQMGERIYLHTLEKPSPDERTIRFTLPDDEQPVLTLGFLSKSVLPILQALVDLQGLLSPLQRQPPRIRHLSQNSPIEVSMEGISKAYEALRDDIIPWRRRHQQELSTLKRAEQATLVAQKKADIARTEAQTSEQIAEASKRSAEADLLAAQAESQRFSVQKEKVELVIALIDKLKPNCTESEKYQLFTELLPKIDVLTMSAPRLEVKEPRKGPEEH